MDKDTFIEKIVTCWIKEDIRRMQKEVKINQNGCGNINFPLALCTLVDMEYLGGFLLGKDCKFQKNVEAYIQRCFSNPRHYQVDILRDIFRNGLAHEFFARGAVSRDGNYLPLFATDELDVVLDAETLVNDFLISLDRFKDELSDANYKSRMRESEKTIKNKLNQHRERINRLPKRSITSVNTSTTTTKSTKPTVVTPPPPYEGCRTR